MGKINLGILGGFSGKVGNVIGGKWKGIDYMRAKATSVKNPRTEGQVTQRLKFATTLNVLRPMTEFVRVGFKRYATKQTAFNAAMSYNLKNAITGYYPNFSVDFEKVLLTRGNLQIPRNVEMVCDNYIIGLTWDTPMIGSPSEGEKAMILIYHPSKSEVVYETSGSDRGVGSHQISVPKEWKDETVEVFISFISEDGRDLSNSLYVGTIGVNSDI